ncbi:hypothetical protein D9M71_435840 [compost metagenome]
MVCPERSSFTSSESGSPCSGTFAASMPCPRRNSFTRAWSVSPRARAQSCPITATLRLPAKVGDRDSTASWMTGRAGTPIRLRCTGGSGAVAAVAGFEVASLQPARVRQPTSTAAHSLFCFIAIHHLGGRARPLAAEGGAGEGSPS